MVKEDFPILKGIVYLDNAATTQKPVQVINVIKEYYEKYNANVHRGIYPLAKMSTELYEDAHKRVAQFINAEPQEIVFVRNTTEGLNIAEQILYQFLEEGEGNIVTTLSEHHSNLLPWYRLSEVLGLELRLVLPDPELGRIKEEDIVEAIDEGTKVVAVQGASNVTGYVVDVKKVFSKAKKYGALTVLDGAQSVPHIKTDVKEIKADFLAFSAHKMLGPMGIGALFMRREIGEEAEPVLLGGDMIKYVSFVDSELKVEWNELPWKFEAGTPNVAGAVGFSAAVDYLEKYIDRLFKEETKLALHMFEYLTDKGFNVIGDRERGGIVAFFKEGMDPHLTAMKLGKKGIYVRSGYHCAQPLHEVLGAKNGSVRASLYLYNDEEDVEAFLSEVDKL